MNNVNRQKIWFLLLFSTLGVIWLVLYIIPVFRMEKPTNLSILIPISALIIALISMFYNLSVTNFNNFHGQFIKLVEFHRNNINSVDLKQFSKDYPILGNHYFFQIVLDDYETIHALVLPKLKEKNIIDVIHSNSFNKEMSIAKKANLSLEELTAINISYLIVFFGMNKAIDSLRSALFKTYNDTIINEVFEWINEWKKMKELEKQIPLHGFQGVLGHYYRHFFGIVKFVDSARFVSPEDKINLINTFRAQLSTFEQSLLVINSLSILGRVWELDSKEPHLNLITKYNLVRNIPSEFFIGIDPKKIYRDVSYE